MSKHNVSSIMCTSIPDIVGILIG